MQWKRMDLHIHTPASSDYQEEQVTYLDILRTAESRSVDILALTDHNTMAGYKQMLQEIADLELLERLGRIQPNEKGRLDEYRRLRTKLLILPGFEFTATLGFHILAVFSPEKGVRELEYLLLSLRVPAEELDKGSSTVGATSDVTTAYQAIRQAGGLVIAAHANSSHGVAMRGFDFGGQTKIAYTQDPNLHALEVTDLDKRGRYSTAHFFDGRKPEYPRPMRCIQGSDAHRLTGLPKDRKNLGIGERMTEALLPETSFAALKELFEGLDFSRTRPFRGTRAPVDFVQSAREAGPSIVMSFHDQAASTGSRLNAIIADVCAFANTNGGTIYVGVSANPKAPPVGVTNPGRVIDMLLNAIEQSITPELEVEADVQETQAVSVIRLVVPRGRDVPYAISDNKIYVRDEAETSLAVRDEIVALVRRSHASGAPPEPVPVVEPEAVQPTEPQTDQIEPPRTGVQIIQSQSRQGVFYHHMRDLRNNNVVTNVTRKSARRLWHYAITQEEDNPLDPSTVTWQGNIALLRKQKRGGVTRYDLAQRNQGKIDVYYGVTEDGMGGPWLDLLPPEQETSVAATTKTG
jgi:hypothetical protein